VYQSCFECELAHRGIAFRREVALPLVYRDIKLDAGLRLDLLVENEVIVELKAVDAIHPVHEAQVLTYLKLSGKRLALQINFNVSLIKDGIRRFAL
jgi:GxxExxY protein